MAAFTEHLDEVLGSLGSFSSELKSALDREKGRLRGVLESLGPAGWLPFARISTVTECHRSLFSHLLEVQCEGGLLDVVQVGNPMQASKACKPCEAKTANKLAYMEKGDLAEAPLQEALALMYPCRKALTAAVDSASLSKSQRLPCGRSAKFQVLCDLLSRLLKDSEGGSEKVLVFVERVAVAGPMAALLADFLGTETTHASASSLDASFQRQRERERERESERWEVAGLR